LRIEKKQKQSWRELPRFIVSRVLLIFSASAMCSEPSSPNSFPCSR
jgi:hypothetical protein